MKDALIPPRLPANRSMPPGVVVPVLSYAEVDAAVKWLCQTFGFAERLRIGDHRSQLVFGGGSVVVTSSDSPAAGSSGQSLLVRVQDVDLHFERSRRCAARMLQLPTDYPYGERQYTVEDFAGYRWTFSQSIADVHPEEWGGVLIEQSESISYPCA